MFVYAGRFAYRTRESHRGWDSATAEWSFATFPPHGELRNSDRRSRPGRVLADERVDFQSREDLADVIDRNPWKTDWRDRFEGVFRRLSPAFERVAEIRPVNLLPSWALPFVVIDFAVGAEF